MKKQHLWYLSGALVLLVLLRLAVDRSPRAVANLEDAGLALVLGADFDAEPIAWIRVTGPGQTDALVVERGAGEWSVTSAFGAPAEGEELVSFLEAAAAMRGELRAEGAALFAEFGLDEAAAIRVELGLKAGEPSTVFFIGAEGDGRLSHFVRLEGGERIDHVTEGLTGALGLVDKGRSPSPAHWLRLELFDLPTELVDRIEAERPDQTWLLEKAAVAGAEEGAPLQWRVVQPATGLAVDGSGPGALLSRVARVRASSVLDPSSEACAEASMPMILRLRAGGQTRALRYGDRALDDDMVAARLEGEATCWGLKRWTGESLMPRASQLLDFEPALGESPPEVSEFQRLDLVTEEGRVRLERAGESWSISQPQRAGAEKARVDRLLSTLRSLRWDDLALDAGLSPTDREVHATITAHAGERSWTLRLLGERGDGSSGARYAELEGGLAPPAGHLAVVASHEVDTLTPSLDELRADESEDE